MSTTTEPKVIDKIRALLAKAESTDFGPEAEAFLDKATELMAQHRIDQAALEAAGGAQENPIEDVVLSVNRYRPAKDHLVITLCELFDAHVGRTAQNNYRLFGARSDLEFIVTLFTSLELQLDRQLLQVQGYDSGDTRGRRLSFARGWTSKVSDRLEAHYAVQEEEAAEAADASGVSGGDRHSTALVLADRRDEAATKFKEVYGSKPRYSHTRYNTRHGAAHSAGSRAGATADIGAGRLGGGAGALNA